MSARKEQHTQICRCLASGASGKGKWRSHRIGDARLLVKTHRNCTLTDILAYAAHFLRMPRIFLCTRERGGDEKRLCRSTCERLRGLVFCVRRRYIGGTLLHYVLCPPLSSPDALFSKFPANVFVLRKNGGLRCPRS